MAKNIEEQIDRLYQLPLDEFTAARNALAKEAGREGTAVKQLAKPPLPAWAVNQLYWQRRGEYESLIDAAQQMRKTHKAVIEGRSGDLRFAGREHEMAVEKALKATLEVLKEKGHPVSDASRHAVLNTLRALPGDEPPGRLSRALSPGGFEMLAGITPAKGLRVPGSVGPKVRGPKDQGTKGPRDLSAQRAREAAERAVREAEHRAKRAEFESARTAREAAKAEKRLADAQEALERAKEDVASAEREAAAAVRTREAAERKARDAESALEAARRR